MSGPSPAPDNAVRAKLRAAVSATGRCVVTSAVPQGASAGIAAYAQGGNAFDAALAACFVETVALPMKCGFAGDLVALFRRPGQPWRAVLSIGAGVAALREGAQLERTGPRSVGVPGAPDGYASLHGMAALPLARLIEPAVQAATHGVCWTPASLSYLPEARELLQRWSPGCVYLDHLDARPGDLLCLPGLAEVLHEFARRGAALFESPLGLDMVRRVREAGGWLREEDLTQRPARLAAPASLALPDGRRVWATPAPTQGALLLQVLQEAGRQGLLAEAPTADGAIADGSRLARIVAEVRAHARQAGSRPADTGTSVVSAADGQGNAVVVVHSNSFPRFGSGVVLDNGLVLNNRPGRGFDLAAPPGAPAAPAAGAVPPTTLHAWGLEAGGDVLLGATPGGVNQLSWNSQTLAELLRGTPPAQAVTNPRWSVDDAGQYQCEDGARLDAEPFAARALPALSLRSVQQILHLRPGAPAQAFADPRTDARAAGLY